ncbi:MAG: hypothetical protein WCE74_23915, partial [Pseudolabrys sp.]
GTRRPEVSDGAITFADLIGKFDSPYRSGPSKAWLKVKNSNAPTATLLRMEHFNKVPRVLIPGV